MFVAALVVLGVGGAPALAASEPQEMTYRRIVKDLTVTLRVKPAAPAPNRVVALLFELARGEGDKPVDGVDLVAEISPEGGAPLGSYVVHPLRAPGLYGMHVTLARPGVYRVVVNQRGRKGGGAPLGFDVQLGVGVPNPMPAESAAPPVDPASAALGDMMEGMGDLWDDLLTGLKEGQARPELVAMAKRIAQVPPKVVGQGRFPDPAQREEFDLLARKLNERVTALPAMMGDPARARAEMMDIENTVCLRCHTKFRFEITRDLKSWPQFQPAEPSQRGQPKR
jgi:hypothetical protein